MHCSTWSERSTAREPQGFRAGVIPRDGAVRQRPAARLPFVAQADLPGRSAPAAGGASGGAWQGGAWQGGAWQGGAWQGGATRLPAGQSHLREGAGE